MSDWHVGDGSASGLALTGCDVLLAIGCLLVAARQHRQPGTARARELVWTLLAGVLLALAIERQLALLNFITDAARNDATERGVYAARRAVQHETVDAILVGASMVGAGLTVLARRAGRNAAMLTAVVVAMIAYLAIKAVSLHAIDRLLFSHIAGVALGNLVELAMVAAAAAIVGFALRSLRAVRPSARGLPRPISRRGIR